MRAGVWQLVVAGRTPSDRLAAVRASIAGQAKGVNFQALTARRGLADSGALPFCPNVPKGLVSIAASMIEQQRSQQHRTGSNVQGVPRRAGEVKWENGIEDQTDSGVSGGE